MCEWICCLSVCVVTMKAWRPFVQRIAYSICFFWRNLSGIEGLTDLIEPFFCSQPVVTLQLAFAKRNSAATVAGSHSQEDMYFPASVFSGFFPQSRQSQITSAMFSPSLAWRCSNVVVARENPSLHRKWRPYKAAVCITSGQLGPKLSLEQKFFSKTDILVCIVAHELGGSKYGRIHS